MRNLYSLTGHSDWISKVTIIDLVFTVSRGIQFPETSRHTLRSKPGAGQVIYLNIIEMRMLCDLAMAI